MLRKVKFVFSLILTLTVLFLCLTASAETLQFSDYQAMLDYASSCTDEVMDIGNVDLTVDQLYAIRSALPETTKFKFTFTWRGAEISSEDTYVDLNGSKKNITAEQLREMIALLPNLTGFDVLDHRELSNEDMMSIVDDYPELEITWLIRLGRSYSLSSTATAYSTLKKYNEGEKLTSKKCEVLKYAKNLRALDLGHHQITSIDFLYDLPELRILILADNQIEDITPLASLTHLQYVELFTNKISDITALADHAELLDLNLSNNPIADLSPLESDQALERFWNCMNHHLSEEQQQSFIDAHPNCEADFTAGHPTADGWRQHWRYKQYVSMFKTHVWHEFDINWQS